jgi:hypothetical protein
MVHYETYLSVCKLAVNEWSDLRAVVRSHLDPASAPIVRSSRNQQKEYGLSDRK